MSAKITKDTCNHHKNGGCTAKDNSICGFVCGNKGVPYSQVNSEGYAKAKGTEPKKEPEQKKLVPVIVNDDEPELF